MITLKMTEALAKAILEHRRQHAFISGMMKLSPARRLPKEDTARFEAAQERLYRLLLEATYKISDDDLKAFKDDETDDD